MEKIGFTLTIAAILGLVIGVLLWRKYIPAYLSEKAKNLASKEDLAHLTSIVENIKASHIAEIEQLKSNLTSAAQVTERRRLVYEEMCSALLIFIEGHGSSQEEQRKFHAAYAAAWLWASDEVVNELNHFIALQQAYVINPVAVQQSDLKTAYAASVLAMRRDIGFSQTTIGISSYQFVKF